MPSISFLGTGSGLPSADRFFSSTIVLVGGRHLLVDAGEPCVHLLRDRGNLIREIDAVLVTHGHVDHVGGIPALLQGCMLLERKKPLSIHLPAEMIAPLRAWISSLYLTEQGLGFPLAWEAWSPGEPELLGNGVSVTPHPNRHLEDCYRSLPGADPDRPCRSYSLEISAGDFRAVFSGDLSGAEDLAPLMTRPVTVLVCELSHVDAGQLAAVLRDATLHALCLVHLSEDYADDRSELQARMEELLPQVGDVMIPEDGEVLDF
jgi:ribonuclease Z